MNKDQRKVLQQIADDPAEPRLIRDDAKRLLDTAELRSDFSSLYAEFIQFRQSFQENNINE